MASFKEIINKINKAKQAVNSLKGIASKLSNLNYEGVFSSDVLREQYNIARDRLDARRESLQSQLDASNRSFYEARRDPSTTVRYLTYPLSDPCNNWIAFTSRSRVNGNMDDLFDIQMYIPDGSIVSDTTVEYSKQGMSRAKREIDRVISSFMTEGAGAGFEQGLESAGTLVTTGLQALGNELTGGYTNFKFGRAKNPLEEQTLVGPSFRDFNFSFVMHPKSADEAREIEDICRNFKILMLPDSYTDNYIELFSTETNQMVRSEGEAEQYFRYPNVFDIEWRGPIANRVDGFMPSVLTTCKVSHSTERTGVYHDGYPLYTQLDLGFKEIKIITQGGYKTYIDPKTKSGSLAMVAQDPSQRDAWLQNQTSSPGNPNGNTGD